MVNSLQVSPPNPVRIYLLPRNCHVPCHLIHLDMINGIMAEYYTHRYANCDYKDVNTTCGGDGHDGGGGGGSFDEVAATVAVELVVMVVVEVIILVIMMVVVVVW